ncbi:MAG: ABC transporter ATP-binding protein [Chloroflexota bacterium]|nr:MAG: ABC transporter ATP-binding protein [Chloroflexota bacterium]
MDNEFILQVINLKKHFRDVKAVDGISFGVERGQIFGFLGPNGSGKTTTIGMILALIHPTAGEVKLFGKPVSPYQPKVLRNVGALVSSPVLVPYLSARQNLVLIARLYPDLKPSRIAEILELVGLSGASNRMTSTFSTGMKQRLGLGMALLHKPALLVLDEPTNGMDPNGMHEVRNLLVNLANQGVTIFLSSHLLYEVEQICDFIALIKNGRLVSQGEVRNLVGQKKAVKVRVKSTQQAARLLRELPGSNSIFPNGEFVTVAGVSSQAVVAHLTSHGVIPSEVSYGPLDLENLFLEMTNQTTKEMR